MLIYFLVVLFICLLVVIAVLFPWFASGCNNLFLKLGHNNHGIIFTIVTLGLLRAIETVGLLRAIETVGLLQVVETMGLLRAISSMGLIRAV